MTVSSTTSRADANGNGVTTAFTASFRILDQTHIMVLRTQISTGVVTTLALTTDYTVSGVGGSSFTVTCLAAPTADQRLSILRNVPFTQLTDYVEGDPFPAASHEDALDKLTMQVQQLDEVQDRALTLAPNSTGISVELPEAEASALIGWNADADALVNYSSATTTPVTAFAETLLDDTTAAEARTTLGAAASGANTDITSLVGLTTALTTGQGGTGSKTGAVLRGHFDGLIMSTAGSSATMTVAAGEATDSTGADLLKLASALAKTTSAWAVGTATGGLDTGSIANATWYYFYLIRRPDTGVVDVIFSANATSPTLPTNYTQFRRIGSGRTNGSAQWTKFVQTGDYFQWDVPVNDISAANPGTAAVSRTLSVPLGIRVMADIAVKILHGASGTVLLLSDLSTTDTAPVQSSIFTLDGSNFANFAQSGRAQVYTNTSSQIRSRVSFSDANVILYIMTVGWYDSRGRDA